MRDGRERAKLTGRLKDCLEERRTAEQAQGSSFVHRETYPEWRSRAKALLAEANKSLNRAGKESWERTGVDGLRGVSETLERTLREDSKEIERFQTDRAESETRKRLQDRSRDRGFSM